MNTKRKNAKRYYLVNLPLEYELPLKEIASKEQRNISVVIRRALDEYLSKAEASSLKNNKGK